MYIRRIILLATISFIVFKVNVTAYGAQNKAPVEGEYLLSAGGISDGSYIWTIPYETNSFSKINIETGKKENLSRISNFNELVALSGYRCGAYYESDSGERFIFLAPYDVSRPLVRINLDSLKMDYPVRNVGYYFGSCMIVSENNVDYLWLFPGKIKPENAPSETEIVRINLSENKKESSISTKIDDKYFAFSGVVKAEDYMWLLPSEEGQPLIRLRTTAKSLNNDDARRIYTNSTMSFSKITTGNFDGSHLWFVCEDISFMFNDSMLYRCDRDGNIIDSIKLSKDQYLRSALEGEFIYLFAGAEGREPRNIRISRLTGAVEEISANKRKSYVPADVFVGNDSEVLVLPSTKNGKKAPLYRLVKEPEVSVYADTSRKRYRNLGDISQGCELEMSFTAPNGFNAESLFWIASDEKFEDIETFETFNGAYMDADEWNRKSLELSGSDDITILAERNGYYHFMARFVSEDGDPLHAFCTQYIDNIYERLPITITRFDIEDWSDASVIERVTHSRDFGAAFSLDGNRFLKTDAPMDLVPSKEISARDYSWSLEPPFYHTIDINDGEISPRNFFAELEIAYRVNNTETFYESDNTSYHLSISDITTTGLYNGSKL